jgi:hypothetical protein
MNLGSEEAGLNSKAGYKGTALDSAFTMKIFISR